MTLTEIRLLHPEYAGLDDYDLAYIVHKKHYQQLDFDDFLNRVGYLPQEVIFGGDVDTDEVTIH